MRVVSGILVAVLIILSEGLCAFRICKMQKFNPIFKIGILNHSRPDLELFVQLHTICILIFRCFVLLSFFMTLTVNGQANMIMKAAQLSSHDVFTLPFL